VDSELASIQRTQALLGDLSRQSIYNLIRAGRLERVNLGRRAFITTRSLERLLQELSDQSVVQPRMSHI
jgi:hypothetical protein